MKQDTTEWLEAGNSDYQLSYHTRQFQTPYQSTIAFCDWLEELGLLPGGADRTIADFGGGMGANAYYMAKRFSVSKIISIDLNPDLVSKGEKLLSSLMPDGQVEVEVDDWYNLDARHTGRYEGIVSYQCLSWLPEIDSAISALAKLESKWIACTSLFFEGDVETEIKVRDHYNSAGGLPYRDSFYNIYSLPRTKKLFEKLGFSGFSFKAFEMPIDLSKPTTGGLGTYTEATAVGRRFQLSGPLLMPWYFIMATR